MLRELIIFTCFSLLTYQTYYLIKDYRSYETVVNINIVRASISDHPSVSICYTSEEDVTLMLNAIKWAKQNEQEYPFLLKFNQMTQEILNNEKLSQSEKRSRLFTEELIILYREVVKRNLTKAAMIRNWIEFDGFPDFSYCQTISPVKFTCEKHNVILSRSDRYQCYTFFSRLMANMSLTQVLEEQMLNNSFLARTSVDLKSIGIPKNVFSENILQRAFNVTRKVFIVVHEPNHLPSDDLLHQNEARSAIHPGKDYDVIFSKTRIYRKGAPYSECFRYPHNNSQENCITECIIAKRVQEMGCFFPTDLTFPFREDVMELTMCNPNVHETDFLERTKNVCIHECPIDCTQDLYQFEVATSGSKGTFEDRLDESSLSHRDKFSSSITPIAKLTDEIEYFYKAKMSFVDFLGSLGGALSLWLGVSVLTSYDYLRSFIDKWLKWLDDDNCQTNNDKIFVKRS